MPKPSSFSLLLFLAFIFSLASCAPQATPLPPAGEITLPTAIIPPTETAASPLSPTLPPTQPQPTVDLATPTVPASPTVENIANPLVIAYLKGGDVYLWKEGSSSVGLTDTHDAVDLAISDDGSLIAYVRQDPNNALTQELWVTDTGDKPNPHVLVSQAELAALKQDPDSADLGTGIQDLAWRHDTHELAYSTLVLHMGPGSSPNHDVRLVDADTLSKTTLLEKGEGGLFYYSPDGNQIALSNPESISLINTDGTNFRQNVLTFPAVLTYSEYQYHPHPIWAPDSSSLRVAIPPADPMLDPLPPTGLWSIPSDGSPAVKLGEIFAMPFAWPNNAFSPDLEHVAYAMHVEDPTLNQRELRLANPDGSNDVTFDKGESLEFVLWSPDSEHFIYKSHTKGSEGLYLGALDGKPELIVPTTSRFLDIQWLDNTRLAYFLANRDQWELHMTNLSGEGEVFIDTVTDSYPVFDALP